MVESTFAYADLNNDMKVTEAEMHCVMTGNDCPEQDDGVLQMHELTPEQGKWLEDAIEAEFKKDGDITLAELEAGLHAFEAEFDVKVHPDLVAGVEAMFLEIDGYGNNDGKSP